MAYEVQSLWRTLNEAAPAEGGAAFLQELLAKWNHHIEAVKMTRDLLMYMDRTFVPTNRKTPIQELGLRLWRDQLRRDPGEAHPSGEAKRMCGTSSCCDACEQDAGRAWFGHAIYCCEITSPNCLPQYTDTIFAILC